MVKVGSSMLLLVCCALFVVPGAARETKVGSVCGAGEEIESPNCPGMLANDMVQRNALATIYLSCGCTGWKVKHADEVTGRGSLFLTAGHCGNAEVLDGTYNYKTNCAGDGDVIPQGSTHDAQDVVHDPNTFTTNASSNDAQVG